MAHWSLNLRKYSKMKCFNPLARLTIVTLSSRRFVMLAIDRLNRIVARGLVRSTSIGLMLVLVSFVLAPIAPAYAQSCRISRANCDDYPRG